jgi:hypothetical protein
MVEAALTGAAQKAELRKGAGESGVRARLLSGFAPRVNEAGDLAFFGARA